MEVPYSSPVSPSQYPNLAVMLSLIGLLITAFYFMYQMKAGSRNFFFELLIALAASAFLGVGTFFMMLSFGLYV